jgi:Fe-S oxidoreductase
MCPSYMATLDEKHSTRGRANALRLAMAGRLGEAGLGDEGVRGVLDLCLECRACKAECPVGVDVARFKSEFLADYWSRHGTPLRARFLGGIHDVSRWASRLAPVSTWIAQCAPGRWMAEAVLGIDSRRIPPAWTRRTFRERFESTTEAAPVRLFVDTFTNYYNPQVGMAGAKVLRAAGFQVGMAPNGCCGRPLISQGLLEQARAAAQANTDRLYPLAESGAQFVFFEPSCLSAMKEDVPSLLRGDAQRQAAAVAAQSVLFEELLEQHLDRNPSSASFAARSGTIVLHGHCHQKAMGLLPPAKALLSRIPQAAVVDLDAGCCGMAGSFGYAVEHFDVSRAIGERRLLPAARRLERDDVLVASGVSCRHQVADFTSARALHPAELLGALVQETA